KAKLGIVEIVFDALILLILTLGGVLQWLATQWDSLLPMRSIWHGVALVITVLALNAALGLPATLYRIFSIEERFGFNKMTLKLFIVDVLKGIFLALVLGVPLLLMVLWL